MSISIIAVLIFVLAFPITANAYLDPGTGSYLFQILIAGLFGSFFAVKMYWQRAWSWISSLRNQPPLKRKTLSEHAEDKQHDQPAVTNISKEQ
ncbi:MAG: hypothetical protein Q8P58_00080 [Candidatus Adlerbacteria bacterium]|nr:hypothetical protein [Candidatus Adlerbacteria bacterium]